MKKGGRKTPQEVGLNLAYRDVLWNKISQYPEGHLFKTEDVVENTEMANDFSQMRELDYIHVRDGWLSAIREGKFVRMSPNPEKVAQSWIEKFDDTIVEFGDWTAWRLSLYPWEPLEGYRYRCTNPAAQGLLSVGHMKIRIFVGPPWLRGDSEEELLLRALHDMPIKTLGRDLATWMTGEGFSQEQRRHSLAKTKEFSYKIDSKWDCWDEETRGRRPRAVIDSALEALARDQEQRKEQRKKNDRRL